MEIIKKQKSGIEENEFKEEYIAEDDEEGIFFFLFSFYLIPHYYLIIDLQVCHFVPPEEAIRRIENALKDFLSGLSKGSDVVLLNRDIKSNPTGFIRILSILNLCHQLLVDKRTVSQRDVYYELIALFAGENDSQSECNREIMFVTKGLKVSRISINIYPGTKGLLVGRLKMLDDSGTWIDCSTIGKSGKPINGNMSDLTRPIISDAKYILVIEKEGIFEELSEGLLFVCFPSILILSFAAKIFNMTPCILITAKGMPDVASRALVTRLSNELSIPALGICDWNPGGAAILITYRYGSTSKSAEGQLYPCENFHWLGLLGEDVISGKNESLPLSLHDQQRLNNQIIAARTRPFSLQTQLEIMREQSIRVELQALRSGSTSLVDWVLKKIIKKAWIKI